MYGRKMPKKKKIKETFSGVLLPSPRIELGIFAYALVTSATRYHCATKLFLVSILFNCRSEIGWLTLEELNHHPLITLYKRWEKDNPPRCYCHQIQSELLEQYRMSRMAFCNYLVDQKDIATLESTATGLET